MSLGRFEQDRRLVLTITIRDITRRKQAEAEIERRVQQLASLAQMGQVVTTRLDQDEILKAVIDQVMLRLAAEGVSVLLWANPDEMVFAAVNGASADKLRGRASRLTSVSPGKCCAPARHSACARRKIARASIAPSKTSRTITRKMWSPCR